MKEAPESWHTADKRRWKSIWEKYVHEDLEGYEDLRYCAIRSISQSSYRPHYIHVWGIKAGHVRMVTYASYGETGNGKIENLTFDGTYHTTREELSSSYTWLRAIPADLSWYYDGKDEPIGRKGRHRGIKV
ncbi:MAG: hypothetical protein WCG80_00115 [Spirochaetales bacterium]